MIWSLSRSLPRAMLVILLAYASGALNIQAASAAAPTVVINEFMASNQSAVEDPQRDFDDWVEIYNPDRLAVDVGGMYLSDDSAVLTKWQFPVGRTDLTTIAPRGYLLIWADGDVTAAGLHADFRLNADGEELHLVATDGTTVLDSIEFGEQAADVSYGRYPDGDPNLRHMADPTPGATNTGVYEGIAADPQFSLGGCLCTEPLTITLTTETPGATIYYTVNGNSPYSEARDRAGGFVYTKPINITSTTTVKAITWLPGWRQSRVRTERYTFIASDVRNFNSPVPIAVVDTMGKTVSSSQVPAYSYFIDTARGTAYMTGQPDFAGYSALNVRGKSSEGFAKKQYHLEVWDEDDRDTDASILGMPPESDWVLQGPYSDKSLMRNVLAYRWSNEIGQYAPRTRFIEVFLNVDSTVSMSDYIGVYVLMEKIKIAPGRVDIAELSSSDNAEPEITGGYIVKKDKFDGGDVSFRTSTGLTLIHDDPIGQDLTQEQKDWIKSYINAFESVLYGPNFRDPIAGYPAFIDEASFIEHHIIVELTKNIDGFRLSTYMYKDRNGKLHMGPVWDYNLSLGNANYLQGWIASGWYHPLISSGDYPWWRRLFEDPDFRLHYADRWFAARRELFTTDRLLGMIDDYAALLDEPQARNFDRWPVLGRYVWPNWYVADTYQQEIDWMKDWLADRLTWMDGQVAGEFAPPPPTFSQQGGHVEAGFALEMGAPSGRIFYTLDGSDPRSIDPSSGSIS
ncbi:MAG: CotH kinase family protein, partial [Planctomycetota bacterium]